MLLLPRNACPLLSTVLRSLSRTLLTLLLAGACSLAQASHSVTLAWDVVPEPDIAGYRLDYGISSGNYTQSINVGLVTTVSVTNLTPGNTYYFVVTALNSNSIESLPSNEASFTVYNQMPSVSLTSPGDLNGPASISISASASDADGTIQKVEFYEGNTKLGEATSAPYSLQWNNVQPGSYNLRVVAYDNDGAVVNSSPAPVNVIRPATSTIGHLANGSFQFNVTGAAGRTNRVYASSDLQHWSLLATAVNSTGTLQVTDPAAATESQRFYKVEAD